jgi:hypothetical protein
MFLKNQRIQQTTVDFILDISNDNSDQRTRSTITAATNGVLSGELPPDIGPKDLCITPILKSKLI